MGRTTLILGSMVRSAWRTLSRPRPRPTWSVRQRLVHGMCQAMLERASELDPRTHRDDLAPPRARGAIDATVERLELAGQRAIRFVPPKPHPTRVLLHLHGGGYVVGDVEEELVWCSMLAVRLGVRVVTVNYRLAPEHPFPAAFEDALAAVRALVDDGTEPGDIVLTGDSAGGGLALAAVLHLRDSGGPQVAGAVLGSPSVDLSRIHPDGHAPESIDYLPARLVEYWTSLYVGSASPTDPRMSPLLGDMAALPRLRFILGEDELLATQILACARKAEAAGVDVQTHVGDRAVHCWYRMPGMLPGPNDGTDRYVELVHGTWSSPAGS